MKVETVPPERKPDVQITMSPAEARLLYRAIQMCVTTPPCIVELLNRLNEDGYT